MSDSVSTIFPRKVPLQLDEVRQLELLISGLQYLDDVYGNTGEWLKSLNAMNQGKGRVYMDLPHFVYACLLDADEQSPLSHGALRLLLQEGAEVGEWVTAVGKAATNFFMRRTLGEAAKANPGALGPGSGPTDSSSASAESPSVNSEA